MEGPERQIGEGTSIAVQVLLNKQARAITGLLRSTPRAFLETASCLPTAQDLLDHRQTRFAV